MRLAFVTGILQKIPNFFTGRKTGISNIPMGITRQIAVKSLRIKAKNRIFYSNSGDLIQIEGIQKTAQIRNQQQKPDNMHKNNSVLLLNQAVPVQNQAIFISWQF